MIDEPTQNDDPAQNQELPFGEQLLGLQGFSAARAQRYRQELELLLVHRISPLDRWGLGAAAIVIGGSFILLGILAIFARQHPQWLGLDNARLLFAATSILTGLTLGLWLLRIALHGGYARRLGDHIGLLIALLPASGWGITFLTMAWDTPDPALRLKLLLLAVTLFVVMILAALLTHLQRMHRQTQEKLLRLEYHLAQLLEHAGQ